MGLKCFICKRYDPKRQSLFRIPNRNEENSERWFLWLKLLDEKHENLNNIRICSDHFLKKKPAKKEDYLDLDWIPSQNLGIFEKNLKKVAYYLKTNRTTSLPSVTTQTHNNMVADGSAHFLSENGTDPVVSGSTIEPEVESRRNVKSTENSFSGGLTNVLNNVRGDGGGNTSSNRNKVEPDVGRKTQIVLKGTGNKPIVLPMSQLKRKKSSIEQKFFFPKTVQTELTAEEIDLLFLYYKNAVEERNELLLKISTLVIDVKFFENNDKKTRFYTGLTTWKLFNALFKLVEPFLPEHGNAKLSPFQMLALTLMKLRLNLTFTDLGYRFQIETNTASNYFHRCIFILFQLFHNSKMVHWPEERSQLLFNTPSYFRCSFKDVITIIIDCFEIFIERPSVLRASAQAWSQYKHHVTLKYLIGISTTGVIIFISVGFGGRTSDKSACTNSGFLDKLQEGDVVLADKGFLIENEVEEKGASLKLPCFVKNGGQLNPTEVEETRQVANLRIHVERVISVLRQKFNICSDHAAMSAISKRNDLFDNDLYDKIIFVCCCLVNMCPSVVRHDFEI